MHVKYIHLYKQLHRQQFIHRHKQKEKEEEEQKLHKVTQLLQTVFNKMKYQQIIKINKKNFTSK